MTSISHINTLLVNSSLKSVDFNLLCMRYSSPGQKNKTVRTVVNKLNTIDNQFRFFKMELLAGEPDYVVEHVGHLSLLCSCHFLTLIFCSKNQIVDSHLTLLKSIGTPDYILSMIGLSNNSILKTSSPMCLQE
jgi:hypothetical protein